jgi:lactate permease
LLPFAVFSGLCFTIPYTLTGVFLGPEFPTLIGSLLGLIIIIPAAKAGFLIPKDVWDFPSRKTWPPEWEGEKFNTETDLPTEKSIFRAWLPYGLVAVFLLASRLWPWLQNALASVSLNWKQIFSTQIDTSFQPLFLPGFLFLIVTILTLFIQKISKEQTKKAVRRSFRMLVGPTIALAFAVPMVKVFINSGIPGGLDKMPVVLAAGASALVGKAWVGLAAVIGAMGAFIAGSNTFSNMMFSLFQFATAIKTGAVPGVIVALQAVGGAAGNMICVHNVVAASAVVGLVGKEGHLIRKTLIPMVYYLIVAAGIGIIMLRVFKI